MFQSMISAVTSENYWIDVTINCTDRTIMTALMRKNNLPMNFAFAGSRFLSV
ncbi:MAG: hypothetical protein J6X14_07990 [Lachnospiraceae bacterium]|nr:hypothetical protein [Lachnospiraceae bacterium]